MSYTMKKLQRYPELFKEILMKTPDGTITAKKELKILFPESWVGRDLAWIEGDIRVLTKCMIMTDNRYSVMNECAHWPLTPDNVSMTDIDGVNCYEFTFEKGSVVCPNYNLIMDEDILYSIFTEMIEKGRVPPYFSDTDLSKMYLNSEYHTGRILSASNSINEMVASSIVRKADNELIQYRHVTEKDKQNPVYIAFRSPVYMASTTITKMSTAFFKDGVTSALLTDTKKIEPMERIVRA